MVEFRGYSRGMWYVYKITNLVNGKLYVGKTDNIRKRWNGHKTAARRQDPNDFTILHRAMRKYGFDNFKIERLSEHMGEEVALAEEVRMIAELNTRDRSIGYNMTEGGDGASGYKFTDEQRKKLSKAKKGKYVGEDNHFYGKHHTAETRALQSQLMKSNYQTNPEKYDQLNMHQCAIDTEECIGVQQQWLQGATMEELEKKHSISITTIHSIIRGTYVAIRKHSILTGDMVDGLIRERHKEQVAAYKKFSPEQDREIAQRYLAADMPSIGALAKEFHTSNPTIKKALKANGIEVKKGPRKRQSV